MRISVQGGHKPQRQNMGSFFEAITGMSAGTAFPGALRRQCLDPDDCTGLMNAAGRFGASGSSSIDEGGSLPPATPPQSGGNGNGGATTMKIADFMQVTETGFGTSGVRSLVSKLTDEVCYVYTLGFIQHLEQQGEIEKGTPIAIAGDLRSSTDRIMRAVGKAIMDSGYMLRNMGKIPSPAIALYGIENQMPAIMVTGSHIPDDRNGIKYNKPAGEILKTDEAGIKEQVVVWDKALFNADGSFADGVEVTMPSVNEVAEERFVQRYLDFFPQDFLVGEKIGLYEHSAVGRDIFKRILESLGADVVTIGRSKKFIPVDTEAIRDDDKELAQAEAPKYFALVSTDGDSDRPLVAGQNGRWFRGDELGILVSKFLNADAIATPVSCNTALEKSGWFPKILRTRIGSPYVIAAMNEALAEGAKRVVSYEANGGFLTATDVDMFGNTLTALPTRDAFLPILAVLWMAVNEKRGVADLRDMLPSRFTESDRLEDFPNAKGKALIAKLVSDNDDADKRTFEQYFGKTFGSVESINRTDGARYVLVNGEIVHFRPSGNADEFRAYTEAESEERALQMNEQALASVKEVAEHI